MEPLSRPVGPSALGDRARAWLEWFGVARLIASAVAVMVVCAGVVWLVRSPPPPTEASLPVATTAVATDPTGSTAMPVSPSTSASSGVVLVHVAGAVVEPGVYELLPGARVRDAVVAAGGPTEAANWDAVNLAAVVADGTRVHIPAIGEQVPVVAAAEGGVEEGPVGAVDVNRASPEQLDTLPGVGPATAQAIVTERDRNGPFVDVDDLDRVPGIGPAKLEALRDLVST